MSLVDGVYVDGRGGPGSLKRRETWRKDARTGQPHTKAWGLSQAQELSGGATGLRRDGAVRGRYIDRRSRTHDQMVQAARSGVQNIAEGSQASGTPKKMELKLTNVARASLEELCLDYEDFLRQRNLPLWERDDPRRVELIAQRPSCADDVATWARKVHDRTGRPVRSVHAGQSTVFTPSTKSTYPVIAANAALALWAVACSLLDRQLAAQARAFEQEGGFTERLYRKRQQARRRQLAS